MANVITTEADEMPTCNDIPVKREQGPSEEAEATIGTEEIPYPHPRKGMRKTTWILTLVGLYLGALLYGIANIDSTAFK